GNQNSASVVHGYAQGKSDGCGRGWTAVTGKTSNTFTGKSRNGSTQQLADAMVIAVCDVDVSRSIYGHRRRSIESSRGCGAIVPKVALLAVPGHRGDDAVIIDAADTMIVGVRNQNVSSRIGGHGEGPGHRRPNGRAIIAGESCCAGACH